MNSDVTRKPKLRDAQRELTRQRILEAARTVFYREGYYGATIDQIVSEAGVSRPTFYLHFNDKEQILEHIFVDYSARVASCAEQLPGPRPTLNDLCQWLFEVAALLEREKASFSAISEVSAHRVVPSSYGCRMIEVWRRALSRRAPAFAAASERGKRRIEARAIAERLIMDITWAAANAALFKNNEFGKVAVRIVAESLHDFLRDPRFSAAKAAISARGRNGSPKKSPTVKKPAVETATFHR